MPGNEIAERIDALVAGLPDNLKHVVKLEYLGHDSRKQNAKRLYLSYDVFRSRLRTAKGMLAAAL
jgi:DNA-directed RNA polymerase specialized sigma24 family protein